MEPLLVLLVLIGIVYLFAAPFLAFQMGRSARKEVRELTARVAKLERTLHELSQASVPEETKAFDYESLVSNLKKERENRDYGKSKPLGTEPPPPTPEVPIGVPVSEAMPKVEESQIHDSFESKVEQEIPSPERVTERVTPSIPTPTRRLSFEQLMGVRLFAWLGGFALFLAAGFFIRYSFEHGLIPPWLRVAMGFVFGGALIAAGLWLSQRRYKITADSLCATGVVSLYAVTFACRSLYHFPAFNSPVTFIVMSAITAGAFYIAYRFSALVVAILGMLGGFLTPILLSSGQDNPWGLFSYIAILDLGLFAVTLARGWGPLNFAAAVGTVLMQVGWVLRYFNNEKVFVAMAVFLGFGFLYFAMSSWVRYFSRFQKSLCLSTILLALITLVFSLVLVRNQTLSQRPGVLFMFLFGAQMIVIGLNLIHLKVRGQDKDSSVKESSPASDSIQEMNQFLRSLPLAQHAAGMIVFLLLGTWTIARVNSDLMYWALGGYLIFGIIHVLVPVVVLKWFEAPRLSWPSMVFPLLSLCLVLLPLIKFNDVSSMVWLVVLLLNLGLFGLSVFLGSLVGLLIGCGLTLVLAFVWVGGQTGTGASVGEMLGVVGILGFGYLAMSSWKVGRARYKAIKGEKGGEVSAMESGPAQQEFLLSLISGVFPYALLMMMMGRLELTSPNPIFGLGLVFSVLLLLLGKWIQQPSFAFVAVVGSYLIQYVWMKQTHSLNNGWDTLIWNLIFYGLLTGFPFFFLGRSPLKALEWIAAAISGPLHFLLIQPLVQHIWKLENKGLIPFAFLIPATLGTWILFQKISEDEKDRNRVLAWFGGTALLFLTLIFPQQFDREWLTLCWALEGAALIGLFRWVPHGGLRWVGLGLLVLSFTRLALNPAVLSYHPRASVPIWNWYLYVYGTVIVSQFVGGVWLRRQPRELRKLEWVPMACGTVLLFLLMNIEIADYFTPAGQRVLTFEFSGNLARDLAYTIGWSLFALGLLMLGILKRIRPIRLAGIGLLLVTLLKLFFHDLSNLHQLYRIAALVGVALVAMLASFLYQKYLSDEMGTDLGTKDKASEESGRKPET